MVNVEFVPNHHKTECYICNGKGCDHCDNTGIYVSKTYFLIYEDKNGLKQAFLVDTIK